MKELRSYLTHPFWASVAVLAASYLVIEYGIPYLPPLVGVESAPVPDSVVVQYFLSVLLAILLYVSSDEERWRAFREPLHVLLTDPGKGVLRVVVLLAAMAVVGWTTYSAVRPSYGAPASLRSIHPAPPDQIQFRGQTMRLSEMENPLREEGSLQEHVERGQRIYVRNCVPCHGDRLDGQGHYASAFNPTPLDLTSGGNLPQLSESFVFWRIAKGGPGLPPEGTPWNSAMPAWEDVLTEREIWSVIVFLYERTGFSPREMEGGHGDGGGETASRGSGSGTAAGGVGSAGGASAGGSR